jgi:hypothetical protein
MRPWTVRALAVGVDAVCLALFVALGRASHDISSGIAWYLTVLWPFLVGWFVVALALQLYGAPLYRWVILVTFIFIGLTTFGWRLFVHGLGWVRSRDAHSPRIS